MLCCAVQLPPSSRSGDNWIAREYTNAIKAQQNFELQLYVTPKQQQQQQQQAGGVSSSSSSSNPQQPPGVLMQAQFRCAANTGIDNNMLPIGIPNFLPNEGDEARCFYFATLRELPRRKQPDGRAGGGSQMGRQQSGNSSGGLADGSSSSSGRKAAHDGGGSAQQYGGGAQFSLMASGHDPMPDIKLGPLLGKGAFGRVYRGEGCGWVGGWVGG
jgi:hypothetical protein